MGYPEADFSEGLLTAACETLETLAFTEVSRKKASILEGPPAAYQGSRIQLGTLGSLDLIIDKNLLQDIGLVLFNPSSGQMDSEGLTDALKEIVNIIAGRFLDGIFKGKSDFVLGLPETYLDLREWNALPMRFVLAAEDEKTLGVGINPQGHGN